MIIYKVMNYEDCVGCFFQAAFSSKEKAEAYLEAHKDDLSDGFIEQDELDREE